MEGEEKYDQGERSGLYALEERNSFISDAEDQPRPQLQSILIHTTLGLKKKFKHTCKTFKITNFE